MTADIIVDFDTHLKEGRVYLIEVENQIEPTGDDDQTFHRIDVYVVATSSELACYIVSQMYPDALSLIYSKEPIGEYDYAARRHRSNL